MISALLHKIYVSNCQLVICNLKTPAYEIKNPSPVEKEIRLEQRRSPGYFTNPKHNEELLQYYKEYGDVEVARNIFDYGKSGLRVIEKDGITMLSDCASEYYNVINGDRLTTDSPDEYDRKIHIFGNCVSGGSRAEDKYTIASHLQRKLNEETKHKIKVINHSNWRDFDDVCRQVLSPLYTFDSGDIVVLIGRIRRTLISKAIQSFVRKDFVFYADFSHVFQRPHNFGEIFFDRIHMQHNGYALLSQKIFKVINHIIRMESAKKNRPGKISESLYQYIDYLRAVKASLEKTDGCYGCLVIAANRFTEGCRYFIDEALKQCDFLYIMILNEEGASRSLQDRMNSVVENLKEYKNIKIVRSATCPVYSRAVSEDIEIEDERDMPIDVCADLLLFCKIVAKELSITKRFVESEPQNDIERQYNESMRGMFKKYGIDVCEI